MEEGLKKRFQVFMVVCKAPAVINPYGKLVHINC